MPLVDPVVALEGHNEPCRARAGPQLLPEPHGLDWLFFAVPEPSPAHRVVDDHAREIARVTERKTAHDFARCMYELAQVHYRDAETIRVVLDNLSAHKPAALYEVFAPEVAREVLRRLEFHFVPKHANWLNMVEFEIGVMVKPWLDRRIADRDTLRGELASWQRRRNAEGARVKWLFDVRRARKKLARVYPTPLSNELAHAA